MRAWRKLTIAGDGDAPVGFAAHAEAMDGYLAGPEYASWETLMARWYDAGTERHAGMTAGSGSMCRRLRACRVSVSVSVAELRHRSEWLNAQWKRPDRFGVLFRAAGPTIPHVRLRAARAEEERDER